MISSEVRPIRNFSRHPTSSLRSADLSPLVVRIGSRILRYISSTRFSGPAILADTTAVSTMPIFTAVSAILSIGNRPFPTDRRYEGRYQFVGPF